MLLEERENEREREYRITGINIANKIKYTEWSKKKFMM